MAMRGVKSQQQKIRRPFLHHVFNRTNRNSISARFFARAHESEIENDSENFLHCLR
jgi:hypothetical protein